MGGPFVDSPLFSANAETIRDLIRSSEQALHIRVLGPPGIGKTRFILETTGAPDITPLVIYTTPDTFRGSGLLNHLLRDDSCFNAIVVVDECGQNDRISLWNQLQNRGPLIKLITINNEPEAPDHGVSYVEAPDLSKDQIEKIIQDCGVREDKVDRWAEFAGNSPRFARMIGINLKEYPDDILKPVENIYNRVLAGHHDPEGDEVKRRRRVLTHIALFKRLGYRKPYESEARAVAGMIALIDPSITWGTFQEIVGFLRGQQILQGESTFYITPQLLHIGMWVEWWKMYGDSFLLEEFLAQLPEHTRLREWFYEMFKYAAESQAALRTVHGLLGADGPFHNDDFLRTELGSHFF